MAGDAGSALDLIRALRSEGIGVAQVRVGTVHIELATVIAAPAPSRAHVGPRGVIAEYGGAAVEKLLAEGGDDDLVPAVKA